MLDCTQIWRVSTKDEFFWFLPWKLKLQTLKNFGEKTPKKGKMDYQYPAENLDFDEIVEEQLELYKSA